MILVSLAKRNPQEKPLLYCHKKLQCLFSACIFLVCQCPGFLVRTASSWSLSGLYGNAMTSSSNEGVVVTELCTLFALYFDVLTNMELEVLMSSAGVDSLTTFVMVTVFASCDCLGNVLLVTGLCIGLVVTHFSIGILFDVFSSATLGLAVVAFSGLRTVDGAG